jgi:hypothetical protein
LKNEPEHQIQRTDPAYKACQSLLVINYSVVVG